MRIYCCGCSKKIDARLTNGAEIYPHRKDLSDLPFWKCDICGNYVGCHHKTDNPTKPLGCIPNSEIKNARKHIHNILDQKWTDSREREAIYKKLSDKLGMKYHTADIRTIKRAREIYRMILEL